MAAGVTRESRFNPLIRRFLFGWWRLTRGMTLGVRAIVLDRRERVFLVRHTYVRGWHFPGGGVDPGESFREAVERELLEEADIGLGAEPVLHGIFRNAPISPRDHVAVFVIEDFRQISEGRSDREIAEGRFFALDDLPAETTRGTRARLAEVLEGRAPSIDW